jgi:hypothetical protein
MKTHTLIRRFVAALILALPLAASAQTVQFKNLNLQHGTGTDGVTNYSRQISVLTGADILMVQERTTGDTGWDAPMAAAGYDEAVYRENAPLPSQGDGPAIWYNTATVTILQTEETDLSSGFVGLDGTTDVDKAAVAVRAQISGREFWAVSTHLCWSQCADSAGSSSSTKRVSQITTLLSWVATITGGSPNVVIGGDMNFGPDYPGQKSLFTAAGYTDMWNAGITAGTATANWGDRDSNGTTDMPVADLTTRTHDTRRIDYFFMKFPNTIFTLTNIDLPDLRATCPHGLVAGGTLPSCSPEVVGGPGVSGQQWDIADDFGVRPSDHNLITMTVTIVPLSLKRGHMRGPGTLRRGTIR